MNKELPICTLCQSPEKPADQTGSHILSFFLIKGATNMEGEKGRDKEITFSISPITPIDTYFGRAIIPEVIEKLKGRDLTDEEIQKNINPFTVDNLVCRDCEKRFGTIETYFNEKIYLPLQKGKFEEIKDKKESIIKILDTPEGKFIRLFIYLQIWRASAAKYTGWTLPSKEEEKLRIFVNELLGNTQKETVQLVNQASSSFTENPLVLTFFKTDKKLTENAILIGLSKMPYFFLVNDICFQYFVKESHTRATPNWFYGLSDLIEVKEHINWKEGEFKIGYLTEKQRKFFLTHLMKHNGIEKMRNIMSKFSEFHQKCFGVKPTQALGKKVSDEIINADLPVAEKYSYAHIEKVFIQTALEIQKILKENAA